MTSAEDRLEALFPNLKRGEYSIESPCTTRYNCIAYAAGKNDKWWWPSKVGGAYWPDGVPKERTLVAFKQAFETEGYEECADAAHEDGYEKVVIYVDQAGRPTHAARQDGPEVWISKCGKLEDIEHGTTGAVGGHSASGYGDVAAVMRRPLRT